MEDVTTADAQALVTVREIIDGVEQVTFEDGSTMDMLFSIGHIRSDNFKN